MSFPLIGISGYRDRIGIRRIQGLGYSYINAVQKAGGTPLFLPVGLSEKDESQMLDRIQGLIVTGGPDINPALYGGQMHPNVKGIDLLRDQTDTDWIKLAYEKKIPLLGICRGFQMINVAFGGSLYTEVNTQHPNSLSHTCYPGLPYDLLSHSVYLAGESKLETIFKTGKIDVNSLHHQGARQVGAGLITTATATDGLVEGIEIPDHPFGIGVQWHPELLPEHAPSQALFKAFVAAANGSR